MLEYSQSVKPLLSAGGFKTSTDSDDGAGEGQVVLDIVMRVTQRRKCVRTGNMTEGASETATTDSSESYAKACFVRREPSKQP